MARASTSASSERRTIEARLALGGDRDTAFRMVARHALRTGLMPIINAMSAAGVIALPGMMTGQTLAGADPVEAVKYQILIMFLIAGGTGIGVFLAVGASSPTGMTKSENSLSKERSCHEISNPEADLQHISPLVNRELFRSRPAKTHK